MFLAVNQQTPLTAVFTNLSMFWMTASHVSCTTSSAEALLATYEAANRRIPPSQASSNNANVSSSLPRIRAIRTSSGGPLRGMASSLALHIN
jgi:hypothetical protein